MAMGKLPKPEWKTPQELETLEQRSFFCRGNSPVFRTLKPVLDFLELQGACLEVFTWSRRVTEASKWFKRSDTILGRFDMARNGLGGFEMVGMAWLVKPLNDKPKCNGLYDLLRFQRQFWYCWLYASSRGTDFNICEIANPVNIRR